MNNHSEYRSLDRRLLLCLTLAAGLTLPLPSLAASVALATAPLVNSTTSTVKPNVMFIIDDSGSMNSNYLPDWANDSNPFTGSNYQNQPELDRNSGFNGVAYNPAVTYVKPVHYNTDGTLNTTTYPSQTGVSAATGANTGYSLPNWRAVKNDKYGIQDTNSSNLEGSASYYVFVAGEYCSSDHMTSCVTSSTPTTVSGVVYDKPAGLRWCDSQALTNCRSINSSTFNYPRYPGQTVPARATVRVNYSTNSNNVTQITVNGQDIMANAAAGTTSESTMAGRIRDQINLCTAAISGNCTVAGFSATSSSTTVTIFAPMSMGNITYTPVETGGATTTVTAFSGYLAAIPGSILQTDIVSTTTSYPFPGLATKASTRTDCAGTTCTYAEEMTNYANWWAYYHTRMQAMKTAVSRAFSTIDNRFRVGYTTISSTNATDGTKFLSNNTFELTHKNSWFTKLFATDPSGYTPLRGALSKAGRYYAKKIPLQSADPVQYSCQQNFTILSTDGYWNTNDEESYYKHLDLADNEIGDMDGSGTPRPMYEGSTASSGSLADIAKYYYDTDLRTSALTNCTGGASPDFPLGNSDVCSNNVFTSPSDNNVQQHMTTFTLGLGVDGTLTYSSDYSAATSGDYYDLKNNLNSVNWSDPISNSGPERIDDLWHAAVNGRGAYFSAGNPDQIISGLSGALSSITSKLGSAAAAATSTLNPVSGNNFAFIASYTTVKWTGNLESRSINTESGEVSKSATWCVENIPAQSCTSPGTIVPDNSGSSTVYNCVIANTTADNCASPGVFDSGTSECVTQIANACTGTLPAKVGTNSDTRTIHTANNAGTALTAFDAAYATANPTYFAAAHINGLNQWGALSATQQAAAAGTNLINYLRGQTGYEMRTSNALTDRLYRTREATMGDSLESQPFFIAKPVFSYPYPGYSDYKIAQASRAGTVFIGSNDGMLHAFNSSTGAERWAYVPTMIIPNMWRLASTDYDTSHRNFINGSPIVSDVCTANCSNSATAVWKTILVAGLNGGGRGYFALDITVPDSPVLLWEFTVNTGGTGIRKDDDLGYTYGRPVVTKKADGTWVVLVTSGYNNTSPGTGGGFLYVLNAGTGAIISKIATGAGDTTTPSGLAQIVVWNDEPAGNQAGHVYGGDLLGNLWRFDINSATSAAIGTGSVLKFATLFSDTIASQPQPITTTPILGTVSGKRIVFVGTGKYLEQSDLINTQVQSYYAIKDDNAATTLVNPRTHTGAPKMVQQVIVEDGAQRIESTTNPVDFSVDRGWYVDFPDGGTGGDGAERMNINGLLLQGTLVLPTIVPSSTVCSPGGYAWITYLDYRDGGPMKGVDQYGVQNIIVSEKVDVAIAGISYVFEGGKAMLYFVPTNDADMKRTDPPVDFPGAPGKFSSTRGVWREIIQ